MTKVFIPKITLQIYRGAMSSADKNNLPHKLDEYKALGIDAIAWHGFIGDLTVDKFDELSKLCKNRGLLSLAAYGLNSQDPINKGHEIAKVSNHPNCYATIFDMEGAWEDETLDKQKAHDMGKEYRTHAPNALTVDQPWFAPQSHWSAFPWEETAEFIDIRSPQVYAMDFCKQYGKQAYEKVWAWYVRDWTVLNQRLAAKGLQRPVIETIQGYHWNSFVDLADCITKNETLIIWNEPFPDKAIIFAIQVKNVIRALGFKTIVEYQTQNGLNPDGDCGPLTVGKLGLTPPEGLVW